MWFRFKSFLLLFSVGIASLKAQSFTYNPKDLSALNPILDSFCRGLDGVGFYRTGILNASIYECVLGGNDSALSVIHWASESRFLDSGDLKPVLIVNFVGDSDTLLNLVWLLSSQDTLYKELGWVKDALRCSYWQNAHWESSVVDSDTFISVDLKKMMLPLPCNHKSVYLYYEQSGNIRMELDGNWYFGRNLDWCYAEIVKHAAHLSKFHEERCWKNNIMVSMEFAYKTLALDEVRAFMRKLSNKGILMEVYFTKEP